MRPNDLAMSAVRAIFTAIRLAVARQNLRLGGH